MKFRLNWKFHLGLVLASMHEDLSFISKTHRVGGELVLQAVCRLTSTCVLQSRPLHKHVSQ